MATEPNSPELADYWSGIHQSINARLVALKGYLRHPASGIPIEGYFRDLLREYLPRRYAVEPGFVVNADGERSDHLDVIIADLHDIPPLCSEPLLKVYPAEAVVAAIEITSAPKTKVSRSGIDGKIPKLEDDLLKLAKLRRLARKREYIDSSPFWFVVQNQLAMLWKPRLISFDLAPRTFIITCGDEWRKTKTFHNNLDAALKSARQRGDNVWINATFSVEHGLISYKPYTDYESESRKENGLLEFVLFLNKTISDYQTFRINISRYRPTLPEQQEEKATLKEAKEVEAAEAAPAVTAAPG